MSPRVQVPATDAASMAIRLITESTTMIRAENDRCMHKIAIAAAKIAHIAAEACSEAFRADLPGSEAYFKITAASGNVRIPVMIQTSAVIGIGRPTAVAA